MASNIDHLFLVSHSHYVEAYTAVLATVSLLSSEPYRAAQSLGHVIPLISVDKFFPLPPSPFPSSVCEPQFNCLPL